jgi:hypothetical protein
MISTVFNPRTLGVMSDKDKMAKYRTEIQQVSLLSCTAVFLYVYNNSS